MTLSLYYAPDSANLVVRMALEEAGADYRPVAVNRAAGEQRSAAFLALNPQGLLPVLTDGETVLYETAAILLHLVDRYPVLGPGVHRPGRAALYRWLCFTGNTLHADLRQRFYAERHVGEAAHADGVRAAAAGRIAGHLALLDEALANSASPWLLDEGFSVCDLYLAVCCRWAVLYPPGQAMSPACIDALPALAAMLERCQQRPAVRRACRAESIGPPYLLHPRVPDLPVDQVLGQESDQGGAPAAETQDAASTSTSPSSQGTTG